MLSPFISVVSLVRVLSPEVAAVPGVALAPLALAFGAGVLAVFNPCGFALLPAFVSYAASGGGRAGEDASGASGAAPMPQRLLRGALLGLPLTAGFLLVFLVAGGVLAAGGRALAGIFPWLGLLVGLALVALGARLLLTGAAIKAPILPALARVGTVIPARGKRKPQRLAADCCAEEPATGETGDMGEVAQRAEHPLRAAWGFGLGYGLSSLGCTLPVFLLVVGSAVAAGGLAQAALVLAA